jgi:hypothetical protein
MRRRRSGAGELPDGVLHLLATGVDLSEAEGEALYGPGFDVWATWFDMPTDPTLHRQAIAAHRRWLRTRGIAVLTEGAAP